MSNEQDRFLPKNHESWKINHKKQPEVKISFKHSCWKRIVKIINRIAVLHVRPYI